MKMTYMENPMMAALDSVEGELVAAEHYANELDYRRSKQLEILYSVRSAEPAKIAMAIKALEEVCDELRCAETTIIDLKGILNR